MRHLLLLIVLFTVHTANARDVWAKDGASKEEFVQDRQFCELYAHEALGHRGGLIRRVLGQNAKYFKCLEERGWSKESR